MFRCSCSLVALVLATALTSAATAQPGPVTATLAPLDQAHTFAQVRRGDATATLLVLSLDADSITAIDLSALAGLHSEDAFDVLEHFDAADLDRLAARHEGRTSYRIAQLAGVGPRGLAHIAAGTNYPAHGEEVGHEAVFLFPKLSAATGPRSTLGAAPGALMDYEVEVCARFDRELRSLADFDVARKGLFLCGDFTDRATLVRNIRLDDIGSGDGFADAKSGAGRFPVGPFLVVPRDWQAFLAGVEIETRVDGRRRQHARAGDMVKDLRSIVGEALQGAVTRTWSYREGRIPMLGRAAIGTGSAVLTGTGAGVIFQAPAPAVMREVMGAPDRPGQRAAIERYLAGETARRFYLQPGSRVRYLSNHLGAIDIDIVAGKQP